MSAAPIEHLELQASEQRERIHQTAVELRSKVDETKRQFSATSIVRRNFGRASAVVSVLGFVFGFAVARALARR